MTATAAQLPQTRHLTLAEALAPSRPPNAFKFTCQADDCRAYWPPTYNPTRDHVQLLVQAAKAGWDFSTDLDLCPKHRPAEVSYRI